MNGKGSRRRPSLVDDTTNWWIVYGHGEPPACHVCGGPAIARDEQGWHVIHCMNCGSYTTSRRMPAARQMWASGRVVPGYCVNLPAWYCLD